MGRGGAVCGCGKRMARNAAAARLRWNKSASAKAWVSDRDFVAKVWGVGIDSCISSFSSY